VTNGVDVEYFHPIDDPGDREPPTLMWAGPMNWYPNRDAIRYLLTEIWPVVAEKRKDARLLLVGKHPPEITADIPAGDRIETPGFVPDVREYMKRAHVYVVPIRVGGGTRLKILDSMSSTKAIVTTSIGCEGLKVEDGDHLMRADDPKTFVERVLHLIDEPATRESLGANGRALVEKTYSWDVVGEIMRDVYRESDGLVTGRDRSGG
jgi:glycosyltransferase involved in cell wall biosynthesis